MCVRWEVQICWKSDYLLHLHDILFLGTRRPVLSEPKYSVIIMIPQH